MIISASSFSNQMLEILAHNQRIRAPAEPSYSTPIAMPSRLLTPPQAAATRNGPHTAAALEATHFAREASHHLLDANGRVDRSQAEALKHKLAQLQKISPAHRAHLGHVLDELSRDSALADTINSVCLRQIPAPVMLDVIRASLNMAASDAVGPTAARKAALAAVMGDLRQSTVNSCFAIAVGIARLHNTPAQAAADFKELLEDGKLSLGNCKVNANLRFDLSLARKRITLDESGHCLSIENPHIMEQPFPAHHIPGLRAAFISAGYPDEADHAALMANALFALGAYQTPACVSSEQVIAAMTAATAAQYGENAAHLRNNALLAFHGSDDILLQRSWEYTMATAATTVSSAEWITAITRQALSRHYEHLTGREDSNAVLLRTVQPGNPEFHVWSINILKKLTDDASSNMQRLTLLQFDADLPYHGGGFVLHERSTPTQPERRIDNANEYVCVLRQAIIQAAKDIMAADDELRIDPQKRLVFMQMCDNFLMQLLSPDFIRDTLAKMFNVNAQDVSGWDPAALTRSPWHHTYGSSSDFLLTAHGHGIVEGELYSTRFEDATEAVHFLLGQMHVQGETLNAAIAAHATPQEYKLTILAPDHAFNLLPGRLADAWNNGQPVPPAQWVEDNLRQPALDKMQEKRHSPPLMTLLTDIAVTAELSPQEVKQLYDKIADNDGAMVKAQYPYSLDQLNTELRKLLTLPSQESQLAQAMLVLGKFIQMPGRIIADTNYGDEHGLPKYLQVSYDPFQNKLRGCYTSVGSAQKTALASDFFDGRWTIAQAQMPRAQHIQTEIQISPAMKK